MEKINHKNNIPFKCTSCGACCRNANLGLINKKYWGLELTKDGNCTNLTNTGMCKIYSSRPLICRNEDLYDNSEKIKEAEPELYKQIKTFKNKSDYYEALWEGCNKLMNHYGIDSSYKINIKEEKKKAQEMEQL